MAQSREISSPIFTGKETDKYRLYNLNNVYYNYQVVDLRFEPKMLWLQSSGWMLNVIALGYNAAILFNIYTGLVRKE